MEYELEGRVFHELNEFVSAWTEGEIDQEKGFY
jgi:hypothetical protein